MRKYVTAVPNLKFAPNGSFPLTHADSKPANKMCRAGKLEIAGSHVQQYLCAGQKIMLLPSRF
jgi:hypothetical protein